MARFAAAVITYSATTGSSPRASSAARAAWAADPRMWRTCVAFASGWRYGAAAASPAALAACRATSVVASLAARWASAAAVRWRRDRGAPSAKTRAAWRAAAGRGSSGRAFWKRTSAGSAHATAYTAIARSSSIVNSKSPERVCIFSSFAQRRRPTRRARGKTHSPQAFRDVRWPRLCDLQGVSRRRASVSLTKMDGTICCLFAPLSPGQPDDERVEDGQGAQSEGGLQGDAVQLVSDEDQQERDRPGVGPDLVAQQRCHQHDFGEAV